MSRPPRRYILEGLTCASCAEKIQQALDSIAGLKAELNFATSTVVIEAPDEALEELALQTIKKIEPEVTIRPEQQAQDEHHEHTQGNARVIIKKILLSGGFFLLALMVQYYLYPGAVQAGPGSAMFWAVLLPYLVAYIVAGGDILHKALQGILKRDYFSENLLMSIATLGAFAIKEFPEAVGVMLFFKVGEYFEDRALSHSRRSIKSLLEIRPEYAIVKRDGQTLRVSPEQVRVGELILVSPGERVPLDGIVIEGQTTVDTSALTGESLPKDIGPGQEILAGMINTSSVITVKVTKPFSESTATRILELVQEASAKKAPTEKFITKFSRVYTPVVVGAALLMAVVPPVLYQVPALGFLFSHQETYSEWLYRSLVFLVIACPCALVISIPVGFFGGIGAASKKGILFKGSNYLEAFRQVHTMVFDKTGTLTEGRFRVAKVVPYNGFSRQQVLYYAALAESHSSHPIAKSILEAYGKEIEKNNLKHYEEIPAHGIRAIIDGTEVLAGNDRILHMVGSEVAHPSCEVPGTVVHIAVDRTYCGYILLQDMPRPEAQETIKALRADGVKRIIMLTGDSPVAAEPVALQLGIDEFYAGLLPEDKINKVRALTKELDHKAQKIAFVGDGINDAPVLATSDIGVAMGGLGSDAAIEAADVVLMKDDLSGLLQARRISRRTRKIVLQNIIMALAIKGFFLVFGAFGLATMWEAVFADVGVAILAILNSTRVLKA